MARLRANGLNDKQERFVREYLVDLDGAAAARRAGYSENSDSQTASHLLGHPKIAARIQQLMDERAARVEVTADRVLLELKRIGFADISELMSWNADGMRLRDSSELTVDQTSAVAEVAQTVTKDGGSLRLRMHSKLDALDRIGRHLNMWQPINNGGDANTLAREIRDAVRAIEVMDDETDTDTAEDDS